MGFTSNTSDFDRAFLVETKRHEAAARQEMTDTAQEIKQRAQQHLPDGAMAQAIRVTEGPDWVEVGVMRGTGLRTQGGADPADAAWPREFGHIDGTVFVPGHPFMRPAVSETLANRRGPLQASR